MQKPVRKLQHQTSKPIFDFRKYEIRKLKKGQNGCEGRGRQHRKWKNQDGGKPVERCVHSMEKMCVENCSDISAQPPTLLFVHFFCLRLWA